MKNRRSKNLSEFIKDKQTILMMVLVLGSILLISVHGISQGLDLKGGSLVQLQLEHPVDKDTMDTVTNVIDKRLNTFGVKDVKVRSSGNQLVIIEMAGVTGAEVEKLIGNPGIFEAQIDNLTVLSGTDIEKVDNYEITGTTWKVPFTVTATGAKKFADNAKGKAGHKVYMYLDGNLIDKNAPELDAGLANGEPSTTVQVQGSANSREEAETKAKELHTILKSGSIPVKVKVIGSNTISPELGDKFLWGAIVAGLLAIIAISIVIFIRYKRPFLAMPIVITSISEVLIVMGIASAISWNIDLSAIVGLIASVGTGVDDQIIITDEVLHHTTLDGSKRAERRRKARTRMNVKNALFIIFASAGTLVAAMLPLVYVGFARGSSGIGVLAGFAFTTILGVLVGIFITRPAYAKFVELFFN
ncbi:MAG: preprotein translocase subunit SecD [Methanobrevibacter sp.]|jgi:preprotein translocase subunit SecD|nr:preprotein translocase subunit SecD [Candidatus Methanovirga basalitermitum]